MPALLVKTLPDELHRRLKAHAKTHRRSMTQEVIVLLEGALQQGPPTMSGPPDPVATRRPLTDAWLRKAIQQGRA